MTRTNRWTSELDAALAAAYTSGGLRSAQERLVTSIYDDDGGEEFTVEQLDAIIAEQMKCLPDWWENDVRAQEEEARASRAEWCIARAMAAGRIVRRCRRAS